MGPRPEIGARIIVAPVTASDPNPPAKPRVVVAMSGGVDSSVAALLLREDGLDVVGLFLRNGIAAAAPSAGHRQGCCSVEDARDARAVAQALGIPFYVIDYAAEFGSIVDRFVEDYRRGRTPNPCALCNRDLKFGSLVSFARSLGAEQVATGHYARIAPRGGSPRLRRAVDDAKDQSYVLAAVEPQAFARARFPLGEMRKPEVRERARRAGLPVAEKRESQEICFVPSNDYRALLAERGVPGTEGDLVDRTGRVLGRHGGFEHFTIGQRRGIGVADREALYVTAIDPATATVTIGPRRELASAWLECAGVTWFDAALAECGAAVRVDVQLRAHHRPVPARLVPLGRSARVEFLEPESACAPGQLAVFYDADGFVLGSGWIERTGT